MCSPSLQNGLLPSGSKPQGCTLRFLSSLKALLVKAFHLFLFHLAEGSFPKLESGVK